MNHDQPGPRALLDPIGMGDAILIRQNQRQCQGFIHTILDLFSTVLTWIKNEYFSIVFCSRFHQASLSNSQAARYHSKGNESTVPSNLFYSGLIGLRSAEHLMGKLHF